MVCSTLSCELHVPVDASWCYGGDICVYFVRNFCCLGNLSVDAERDVALAERVQKQAAVLAN